METSCPIIFNWYCSCSTSTTTTTTRMPVLSTPTTTRRPSTSTTTTTTRMPVLSTSTTTRSPMTPTPIMTTTPVHVLPTPRTPRTTTVVSTPETTLVPTPGTTTVIKTSTSSSWAPVTSGISTKFVAKTVDRISGSLLETLLAVCLGVFCRRRHRRIQYNMQNPPAPPPKAAQLNHRMSIRSRGRESSYIVMNHISSIEHIYEVPLNRRVSNDSENIMYSSRDFGSAATSVVSLV